MKRHKLLESTYIEDGCLTMPEQTTLQGRVMSGRGNAKKHISSEYDSFREGLGEDILPGSLNLILSSPAFFNHDTAISVSNGKRLLWKAQIADQPVWVYRFPHAPLQVAEILAPFHLRDKFGLSDGDLVKLSLATRDIVPLTMRQKLAWFLIWKGRETWSYHPEGYYYRTRGLSVDLGATQVASKASALRALFQFAKRGLR